jgi:outer membrane protein
MKKTILTLSILLVAFGVSNAQKIAHANVNAILAVMPENKKINEDLEIYATGLSTRVQDTKKELDRVIEQFNATLKAGDTAKAVGLQKRGLELDKSLQQANAQAEQQLSAKRNELLQPVLNRIQDAMKKVAEDKGYEYVMNSVDGSGTSIVLWGPEGADITRAVVDELGIELEDSTPASEEKSGGKKKKK